MIWCLLMRLNRFQEDQLARFHTLTDEYNTKYVTLSVVQ